MKNRKFVMGAAAILLPLSLISMIGVTAASAKAGAINQPGTLTCAKVTGTISFSPPLITGGTAKTDNISVSASLKKCSVGGGGTVKAAKGTATASYSSSGNNCTSLAAPSTTPITFNVTWAPASKIKPTSITFPGSTPTTGTNPGFKLGPATSGAGSYPGSDNFKSSTSSSTLKQTTAQITAMCSGAGVSTLNIKSGTSTSS